MFFHTVIDKFQGQQVQQEQKRLEANLSAASLQLWHERLGHLNVRDLGAILQKFSRKYPAG